MFKPFVINVTTGEKLLWRSMKIRKSLDEICHILEMEIAPGEFSKVRKHHKLEVRCENNLARGSAGNQRVTTVLVDEITATADISTHSITVIGRSPARDIIDSTWTSDYPNLTLLALTQNIAARFGLNCIIIPRRTDDPTGIIYNFSITDESPWPKLIDEADSQHYIFTSNEEGNLYLWQAQGPGRVEPFHATEGKNIKSIKWAENGSEQFHKYIIKGGGYEAQVIDNTCPGNRELAIDITDPFVTETELNGRAETEKRRRRANKTTVTVPGWGLTDEQIKSLGNTDGKEIYWVPNLLIPVKVPSLGLDAKLLVSEVEYTATADTMSCDITLVNREAYT